MVYFTSITKEVHIHVINKCSVPIHIFTWTCKECKGCPPLIEYVICPRLAQVYKANQPSVICTPIKSGHA